MSLRSPRSRLRWYCCSLAALFGLLLASCSGNRVPQLDHEELFHLEYGKMEDQVELYLDDGVVREKTRVAMRSGLIYVASGYGSRIMEFTSFGDLVTLYYNPDTNPRPVMLQSERVGEGLANRVAHEYPFNVVGEIAVMSDSTILVEDQVPDRIAVYDEELGVRLNRVVVRLEHGGNQRDYLGQEGVGGSFFPYIHAIDVTTRDDIVVTALAPPRTIVYWFDSRGSLLRRIEITPETLPVPTEVTAEAVLESVTPDLELRRLYAKVNYYLSDEVENGGSPSNRMMSRIYWINIADGSYEGYVDVPRNVRRESPLQVPGDGDVFTYELIGSAPGEHLFLLSQESTSSSQLLILQTSGKVVRRRNIVLDYEDVVLRDLDVSAAGILTGLLATRDGVDLVWWRTDRLFESSP